MNLSISDILKATNGRLVQGNTEQIICSVSTDTRKLKSSDFYIALRGPNFDGNTFVDEAISRGAIGALVAMGQGRSQLASPEFCLIEVADTLRALGDLAQFWRQQFSIPIIAITGSSGKTTTKDMLAACLSIKGNFCQTKGNFNNLVGLPLTVFNLCGQHQYGIFEMGMNAFGEIGRLTEISQPTIGLITNVGRAHLEGVEDIDGVARAKAELFEELSSKAVALVNIDDPFVRKMSTQAQQLTFGFSKSAMIQGEEIEYSENEMRVTVKDPKQTNEFYLPFFGEHYAQNWLACYAVCYQLGLSPTEIQKGISRIELGKMRGEVEKLPNDIVVINDCYNANPDSMSASLKMLNYRFPKRRKVAILGEMLELGDQTAALHKEVGEVAARFHVDILMAYGAHAPLLVDGFCQSAPEKIGKAFEKVEELNEALVALLQKGDALLVKGSRGSRMERVVDFLKQNF